MLRKLNNKEGIVYVTVLMIIIVMMVLTISIISLNVSQVISGEREVKRIKAELLSEGMLAYIYTAQSDQTLSNPTLSFYSTHNLGETYQVSAQLSPNGPPGDKPYNLLISTSY